MPAVTSYRHGLTAYHPNRMGNPNPSKRGLVQGWSPGPAKRNVNFLRSVDERELSGDGWAITLTVRDCPPTPEAWSKVVRAWVERQRRAGMIRLHWVMEFQRRGVPHLHAAAWYEPRGSAGGSAGRREDARTNDAPQGLPPGHAATVAWVDVAGKYGATLKGQHARQIDGAVGWFQYMAKHCGRSEVHYQRQRDSAPAAWDSSPRVWGHRGVWKLQDPITTELTRRQFFQLRRIVRRRRIARVRRLVPGSWSELQPRMGLLTRPQLRDAPVGPLGHSKPLRQALRELQRARAMHRCSDRKLSEVRPVNDWFDQDEQLRIFQASSGAAPPPAG